jgi:esterase/lipase superfamily enzyme
MGDPNMGQHYNYILTNRDYDRFLKRFGNYLATDGAISYTTAETGSTSFTIDSAFTTKLVSDLTLVAGGSGEVSLCIYIHGFDSTWDQFQTLGPLWMGNVISIGGYPGVMVAFDWPSGDKPLEFRDAKERAVETGQETFPLLATFLQGIVTQMQDAGITVTIQLLCHSMGNYLLWSGAPNLACQPLLPISQILNVAAELSNDCFGTNPVDPHTPGAAIVALQGNITVYYSAHDDVLPLAQLIDGWTELGLAGPVYKDQLYASVVGIDSSAVINKTNAPNYPPPPHYKVQTHTSYFYIPETLQDMAQALMGISSSFRTPVTGRPEYKLSDTPCGES